MCKEDKTPEREFEIGRDEAWSLNMKRMYDEYQHESLEAMRRGRTHFDKVFEDVVAHDNGVRQVALAMAQQAAETANMVAKNVTETANLAGKQAIRHAEIAIDRQWNIDEQANIAAVVAAVLAKLGLPKE